MSQAHYFRLGLGGNAQLDPEGDLRAQNTSLREDLREAAQREAALQRQLTAVLLQGNLQQAPGQQQQQQQRTVAAGTQATQGVALQGCAGAGSTAPGVRASGGTSTRDFDLPDSVNQQLLSLSLDGSGARGTRSSQTAAAAPPLPYQYKTHASSSGGVADAGQLQLMRDAQLARELAAREEVLERQREADMHLACDMEAVERQQAVELERHQLRQVEQARKAEQARRAEAGRRLALEIEAEERCRWERDQRLVRDIAAQEQQELERSQRFAYELDTDFDCGICCERVRLDDQFVVGSGPGNACGHSCCRSCAKSYVTNALRDNKLPIPCWSPRCQHTISEVEILSVVDDGEAQLYQELSRLPVSDPAFRPCIEPNCKGFCLLDDPDDSACTCSTDPQHSWCCHCQVNTTTSQHAGTSCEQYQRWKADNDTGDAAMERLLRAGLRDPGGTDRMRRCPRCQAPWMKDQACLHVVCERRGGGCGAHFCFACAAFASDRGRCVYAHQATCRGYQQPAE